MIPEILSTGHTCLQIHTHADVGTKMVCHGVVVQLLYEYHALSAAMLTCKSLSGTLAHAKETTFASNYVLELGHAGVLHKCPVDQVL